MRGKGPTYLATNVLATHKYLERAAQEPIDAGPSSRSKRRRVDSEHTEDVQQTLSITMQDVLPELEAESDSIYGKFRVLFITTLAYVSWVAVPEANNLHPGQSVSLHEPSVTIGASRWCAQRTALDADSSDEEVVDEGEGGSPDEEDVGVEDTDMENLLLEFFSESTGRLDGGLGIWESLGEHFERAAHEALSGMPTRLSLICHS